MSFSTRLVFEYMFSAVKALISANLGATRRIGSPSKRDEGCFYFFLRRV